MIVTCNIDKSVLQSVVNNIRNTPQGVLKQRLDIAENSTLAATINNILGNKMSIKFNNSIKICNTDNLNILMKHNNDHNDCSGHKDVYVECSVDSCGVILHDDIPAVAAWLLAFHKLTSTNDKV